jgi:hypothetical protein
MFTVKYKSTFPFWKRRPSGAVPKPQRMRTWKWSWPNFGQGLPSWRCPSVTDKTGEESARVTGFWLNQIPREQARSCHLIDSDVFCV